jgi:hypothetical protein
MGFFYIPPPPAYIESIYNITSTCGDNQRNDSSSLKLDKNLMHEISLKETFNSLVKAWEKKTMFSSSISNIINDSNFKRIVQMGSSAVPLIIDELDRKPSNLVWALNLITGATLKSNVRLTVTEACKSWVKLYREGKISELNNINAELG